MMTIMVVDLDNLHLLQDSARITIKEILVPVPGGIQGILVSVIRVEAAAAPGQEDHLVLLVLVLEGFGLVRLQGVSLDTCLGTEEGITLAMVEQPTVHDHPLVGAPPVGVVHLAEVGVVGVVALHPLEVEVHLDSEELLVAKTMPIILYLFHKLLYCATSRTSPNPRLILPKLPFVFSQAKFNEACKNFTYKLIL